jgi:hypothetical protein
LLNSGEFKRNSLKELLAWLVWNKEKTIFAKQTLAVILSNIDIDKSMSRFKDMQEELFPMLKVDREEKAKKHEETLKQFREKEIRINA